MSNFEYKLTIVVQTILGSGGSIGIPLARELKNYTDRIRLVSRNPKKVNESDELFAADLLNSDHVDSAIKGSDIVYITIGFDYNLKVWQKAWPSFMKNVISGCVRHNSRLVFFDNVYMYAKSAISFMTEKSPVNPPSRKGEIRAQIRDMILNAIHKNKLIALISRSADFYGPDTKNSAFTIMVVNNLLNGKKAQAFGNIDKIHTYTYTPDAARATALLGNTPDAYNQEWHLPTTHEKLTNRDWITMAARMIGTDAKVQAVPAWMIRLLGVFIPIMREFPEMLYQFEQDYVFDSSKFEKRFGIKATAPETGMKVLIESLRK